MKSRKATEKKIYLKKEEKKRLLYAPNIWHDDALITEWCSTTATGQATSKTNDVKPLDHPPVRDGVLRLSVVTVFQPQLLRPSQYFT